MGIQERKEREREQRKAAIIDCAMKVFLVKGMISATMDEIAECAELSKATLYLYFKNKEELILHAIGCVLQTFTEYLETEMANAKSSREKILMIGEAYLKFYHECHSQYVILNSQDSTSGYDFSNLEIYNDILAKSNHLWRIICDPIDDAIKNGYLRKDVNSMEVAITLWSASNGMLNLMNHVETTHLGQCHEVYVRRDDYLRKMDELDYEQLLKNLWKAILTSYQSK